MLRRSPSLAARASMAYIGIYLAVFLLILAVAAGGSGSQDGPDHDGPILAVALVRAELAAAPADLSSLGQGRLAGLRRRNPNMWLIVRRDGRQHVIGRAPPQALRTFEQLNDTEFEGRFRLPHVAPAAALGSVARFSAGGRAVVVAAGGVDPATISWADVASFYLAEGVLAFPVALVALGLLAMVAVAPWLKRAVAPITRQAAAIDASGSGSRLDEALAPRELVPLVVAFNVVLGRLDVELQRRKQLIADVAHELRTPLAIALLQTDRIADEQLRSDLARSIGRATDMAGQMLDLQRLTLSRGGAISTDLAALAREVVIDLTPLALKRGYDLAFAGGRTPVPVRGDPSALSRAIANLVSNAIEHGGGKGCIEVSVASDRTLSVKDDGPGVPAELGRTLFEPFSKGRYDSPGAGLGLHLTREIMRAHGGEAILVETKSGAQFQLTFPP